MTCREKAAGVPSPFFCDFAGKNTQVNNDCMLRNVRFFYLKISLTDPCKHANCVVWTHKNIYYICQEGNGDLCAKLKKKRKWVHSKVVMGVC